MTSSKNAICEELRLFRARLPLFACGSPFWLSEGAGFPRLTVFLFLADAGGFTTLALSPAPLPFGAFFNLFPSPPTNAETLAPPTFFVALFPDFFDLIARRF
jgi:hypothetical protein